MSRLVQVATQSKCACCRSPRIGEVNDWLSRLGDRDASGRVVTWGYLIRDVMPLLLGRPVTESSLRRHVKLHTRRIEGEPPAEGEEDTQPTVELDDETRAMLEEIRDITSEGRVNPNRLLNLQTRLWLKSTAAKLEKGQEVLVTTDQAARAANSLVQNERNHQQSELLGLLGSAIGSVFERQLSTADHDEKTAALGQGEEVEGEVVHVEESEVVEREPVE